jgi:HEAT repeat protein
MNLLWLILQQLKSADPEKRLKAVARLAAMESPRTFDGLTKAAGDSDSRVRAAALAALGASVDVRATELLLAGLRDRDAEVRQAAVSHLKDDGSANIYNGVSGALRDSDPIVRGHAAHFLEKSAWHAENVEDEIWLAIGHGRLMRAASFGAAAVQPLERVLQGGGNQQAAAVEALGMIPDERVVKPIKRALTSPEHTV